MDKIDKVIFRYKHERKMSKGIKQHLFELTLPIMILLLGDILSIVFLEPKYTVVLGIICAIFMMLWNKVIEGKFGTRKWKYQRMKLYREKFLMDQRKLLEIICDEGMNCQQVYNLLGKKYNRMPQKADRQNFVITIASLGVALTGILVSPMQTADMVDYAVYVLYVIGILICMLPMGYGAYKIISAESNQFDEKKNNYEYVMELLEDYLY